MSELAASAPHGAQPERTALSRQRTALASAGGAAIIARHSGETLGPAAVVILLATPALAATAFVPGRQRYATAPVEPSRRRDGRAPFALALAVAAMALTELLALAVTVP
ncbi:hypothetical protein LP422_18285 [Janibacter limosus]|uniref:Uncharacterized protein n=1 Tax=Janibacter limosus TaxID=53458 RepID=A0AC61U2Z2_9MICO|nr:DUF202 domain-containing protein [Janibacter limosus]UUZ44366.1 hypothetical protein LP422_18285 [Janibacter limosus]